MAELSELGKAAVWYCENGFAIVPLQARGKKPVTRHGLNDWFDDADDARKLWTKSPNLNIGIVCGSPSHGLLVFDFDVDEERDKDGYATLSEWEKTQGELPETAIAITGSGGMHYLYRTSRTNIHPSANPELGVDVRCDGSYIVAPPSVHPNGRNYEWQDHPEDTPIATATGPVYDFLDHVQRNGGQDETKKENGKFKLPDKIKRGERDKTLFRYASHLRAIGRSDAEILNAVAGANFMRCDPPVDSKDVQRIVRSACKYERGESTDDTPSVSRPGGTDGVVGDEDIPNFRGPRNTIQHNLLAQVIIQRNHACIIDGAPALWTGKRWEFGKAAICRMAIMYADDIKRTVRDEVYSYIAAKADSGVSADRSFDGRYYIQFQNATYDVQSGETVTPSPEMLIIGTLPINLNLNAPYGQADRFLASLANDDANVETALAEIVGACMCGRKAMDQSPMLIGRANVRGGEASNGKSTYLSVLSSLLGPNNISSLDIATLGQRFQAARVVGKLANLGDDIPDGFLRGDELGVFKKLVTGNRLYSDIKNGDGIEFIPNATMVFSMNAIPRLADTTDGVFRRLAFIPFRNKFSPGTIGFDPEIKTKMCCDENLERLAVLGLMALPDLIRRRELTTIPDMAAEVEQVRTDNDVVRRWVASECIRDSDVEGRWVDDAYDTFKNWAFKAGEKTVRQDTFKVRLLAVFGRLETYETRDRGVDKRGHRFRWKEE
jgi:P4 family phage/plasmid primase-like protien